MTQSRQDNEATTGNVALGHGLFNLSAVYKDLSVPELYEHAIRNGEGRLAAGGAFVAITGQHTGRSPKDKFIVRDALITASSPITRIVAPM